MFVVFSKKSESGTQAGSVMVDVLALKISDKRHVFVCDNRLYWGYQIVLFGIVRLCVHGDYQVVNWGVNETRTRGERLIKAQRIPQQKPCFTGRMVSSDA